jgi:Polysaccharide lyase family 4, domain II
MLALYRGKMYRAVQFTVLSILLWGASQTSTAQGTYQVVSLSDAGKISGTVKWSGPQPHLLTFPVTKDPQICDPDSRKRVDLDRLIIGPQGGVANTVVFLKDVTKGKAMDIPEPRRFLNQSHCRYEPHILLVPRNALLQMKSSDATLHTIHMDGAATYNLPFPFPNQVISRSMNSSGLVNLKCNGGHVWMNAEAFVVDHPYYAVTDESGKFELTDVPPGEYELVAWHEGWKVLRQEGAVDVLTEKTVQRPIFSDPRTWDKHVSVHPGDTTIANFSIGEK